MTFTGAGERAVTVGAVVTDNSLDVAARGAGHPPAAVVARAAGPHRLGVRDRLGIGEAPKHAGRVVGVDPHFVDLVRAATLVDLLPTRPFFALNHAKRG